jgi:hypothetical protein
MMFARTGSQKGCPEGDTCIWISGVMLDESVQQEIITELQGNRVN